MAGERDRIIELKEYITSQGISINIGKNKARGHKGVFMHGFNADRIDISVNVEKDNLLSVMLHEFAHYIHYIYDKKLSSLDFIFGDLNDDIMEELIKITVNDVPKEFAETLFYKKEYLNKELKNLVLKIKKYCPDFKLSEKNTKIENSIKQPLRYLLRYDRVKFMDKLYSVRELGNYCLDEQTKLYIEIKSKQRAIKRINSRISRLNKYYNNPSELFARFIDSYYTKPESTCKLAPKACSCIADTSVSYIKKLNKIFS